MAWRIGYLDSCIINSNITQSWFFLNQLMLNKINIKMKNKITPDLLEWALGKVDGFSGRSLLELKHGGLKMVKVAPFAKYPIHIHPDKTEFAYVIQGKSKFTIGTADYMGEEGDFFIFPASIKHGIENPSKSDTILLVGSIKN